VTTHAFVSDSPYIDSDAVLAELGGRFGVESPFTHARFDVVLNPL